MGSLLPIMLGLALTSAYDLSFNIIGFLAALTNNLADWWVNDLSAFEFFHNIVVDFEATSANFP